MSAYFLSLKLDDELLSWIIPGLYSLLSVLPRLFKLTRNFWSALFGIESTMLLREFLWVWGSFFVSWTKLFCRFGKVKDVFIWALLLIPGLNGFYLSFWMFGRLRSAISARWELFFPKFCAVNRRSMLKVAAVLPRCVLAAWKSTGEIKFCRLSFCGRKMLRLIFRFFWPVSEPWGLDLCGDLSTDFRNMSTFFYLWRSLPSDVNSAWIFWRRFFLNSIRCRWVKSFWLTKVANRLSTSYCICLIWSSDMLVSASIYWRPRSFINWLTSLSFILSLCLSWFFSRIS